MQVAGVVLDGQQQHHVQELADRGGIGQGLRAGEIRGAVLALHRLGRFGQILVVLHVADKLLDALAAAGVVALQRVEHVALAGHHRTDVVAEEAPQLVGDRQLLRVAHGDRQTVVSKADRQNSIQRGHRLRDVSDNLGRNHHVAEVDQLHAELFGQRLGKLGVVDQAHADGHLADQLTRPLLLLLDQRFELLVGDETQVDQHLA